MINFRQLIQKGLNINKNYNFMYNSICHSKIFQLILMTSLLTSIRPLISGSYYYDFLYWNIFLAIIPNLTVWIYNKYKLKNKWIFAIWLVFFPNSIYILTDYIHLAPQINRGVNYWFDLILLTSATILGFALAFRSLNQVYKIFFRDKISIIKIYIVWLITCFGVYLGREIRLNSWDLINVRNFYNLVVGFEFNFDSFWPFILVWPICLTWWFCLWIKK